jgi:hypothetical protein
VITATPTEPGVPGDQHNAPSREKCSDCKQLEGAPWVIYPHEALKFRSSSRRRVYQAPIREVEHYQCRTCGTRWNRDCNPNDTKAMWTRAVRKGRRQLF